MSEPIVCKPTPWFLMRAAVMILMFGVFAVLFFMDGTSGYRSKNQSYFVWQGIKAASDEFAEKKDSMSAEQWRSYAAEQEIVLPADRSILPEEMPERLPWPDVLGDYELMSRAVSNPKTELFENHMEEMGLKYAVPEHDFDAGKIHEQIVVFWICLALALVALGFLLRTMGRKMVIDDETFQPAGGDPVAITDLVRLDLRKWTAKGLAFAWTKPEGGEERKIRIDGLTYGGFKKDDGEPAEKLMAKLKSLFSGEIIDYEPEEEEVEEVPTAED